MRTLVTGGAGFLGSHLVDRLLADGHEVVVVDDFSTGRQDNLAHVREHSQLSVVTDADGVQGIDIRDAVALARLGQNFDRIYHLACPASPPHYQRDPVRTLETAFIGTRQILNLASWSPSRMRVLITSTSEVYGDPTVSPQPETYWGNVNPYGVRSMYDEGKRAGEALAYAYRQKYDVDTRVARIFNTYGPRMQHNDGRAVSNFIVQGLLGKPLMVSGGVQTRSFCFVSDLIEGLVRLMEHHTNPGPTNLGNPNEITIQALAKKVATLLGRETASAIVYRALLPDDPRQRCPDITKAQTVLGWTPTVDLETGLRATVPDLRRQLIEKKMLT